MKKIKIKTFITYIPSVWVTRPTRSHLKATGARLRPIGRAWRKFWGFEAPMRQYKFELTCFRSTFCFINILASKYRRKMVLYSKYVYGSQFKGEKKTVCNFVLWFLKYETKCKVVFFLGRPVYRLKYDILRILAITVPD